MPRGPFNTTAEFFHGPNGVSPGTSRGEAEVRFVDANGIFAAGDGHPEIIGWITIAEYEPRGSWTSPLAGFKPSLGDDVLLGDESEPSMWVAFVEHIDWEDQPDYFRASVCFLPRPSECSCAESESGSCEEAEPIELDTPVTDTVGPAPAAKWYAIDLAEGIYHVTHDSLTFNGECDVLLGPCEDLTLISSETVGCIEFEVPEGFTGTVYIRIQSVDEEDAEYTITVEAGAC